MIVPRASPEYEQQNEQASRDALDQADAQNVKRGRDIYMKGGRPGVRNPYIVLYSPSGDPFYLSVADDGTLSAVAVP